MNLSSSKKTIVAAKRADALPPPPKEVLSKLLGVKQLSVEWLAGDGSDRCYYRLHSSEMSESRVLMQLSGSDADALKKDGYDWIKIADTLANVGIPIPNYKLKIPEYAALVIEDYGDTMLESNVIELSKKGDKQKIQRAYEECFEIIARLLLIKKEAGATWCNRAFDYEKYIWELRFFYSQYVNPVAKVTFSDSDQKKFETEIDSLAKYLSKFSLYFVHRDFHSRNIMVKDDALALIDFQDARLGPAAYDLVSLLFDNYVPFDLDFRLSLLARGKKVIVDICGQKFNEALEEHCRATILQRQLKAIGTYGFLTYNKKRGNYLGYVEPALATLTDEVVYDERWPFLSKNLIHLLKENLEKI